MSQEAVLKTLLSLGLTQMDSRVYLFLAKKGPQKGKDIITALKINRPQLYRSLKSLQGKGIVSSTLQRPARFSALPFDKALDMFIKAKMEEGQRLAQNKSEILSQLQSTEIEETLDAAARFMVVEGRNYIYSKILQMINETKKQLSVIATVPGLVRASQFGLFDAGFKNPLKSTIRFRFLTDLTPENVGAMKALLKSKPYSGIDVEGRNLDSGLKLFPRLAIKDEEEIIFFISSNAEKLTPEPEDTGLWTNSRSLVHAFREFFEELWRNALDLQKKIVEIETGKPTPETHIIRDAETAYKKYVEIIGSAKEEIIKITSSKGLIRFWKNMPASKTWVEKGVSVKIMAPITSENLRVAQQLSKYCAVRHVYTNCPRTVVVDGKHLFLFKTPPPDQEKAEAMIYFENTFYTNDFEYVERMKSMLNDIWNGACELSAVTLDAITRSPAPTVRPLDSVSDAAEIMAKKDVGAVIVTENKKPVGIITEKDIINRVIKTEKDPTKTLVKDVMSTPVITIDHKQTSKQALEVMRKHKIRRLAVIKGERLAGLITERRALRSCSLLTQLN